MKHRALFSVLLCVQCFAAFGEAITSNVSTVRAWLREPVTFDTATGRFSRGEFPTAAQAEASHQLATNLPAVYQEATDTINTNLAPLRALIEAQRARPVTTLVLCAGPNAALDRRNLTFRIMSNEVHRVDGGLRLDDWVYGNNVLRSNPVMECDFQTVYGGSTNSATFAWDHYGTNGVTIAHHGEDYECYKMSATIPTSATNLNVYVNPWITIARPGQKFNFGNRRARINQVYTCTTNDLSFLGRFYTTNGVEITDFIPYADNGYLSWTERTDE